MTASLPAGGGESVGAIFCMTSGCFLRIGGAADFCGAVHEISDARDIGGECGIIILISPSRSLTSPLRRNRSLDPTFISGLLKATPVTITKCHNKELTLSH